MAEEDSSSLDDSSDAKRFKLSPSPELPDTIRSKLQVPRSDTIRSNEDDLQASYSFASAPNSPRTGRKLSEKVQLKERYLHLKELGLGKEKLQLYKLLIFGPPGVGKSSLFEVLLGKNRNTTRNSTGVLNVVQVQVKIEVNKPLDYLSPSKLTPSLQSPSFWHEVDRKQQKARLHTIIKRKVKSSTVLLRSNSLSTEEDQCKKLSSVEQSILEEKYKTQRFSKTMLICYDSGGHLEFFDVMPALTTLPTGNIMVFNMEKGLGDCEVGGYHINGKKYTSQGNANLKFDCTKLLQTAIANIQSLSKRRSASSSKMIPHNLLVVGTHLDKCGTDTEKHETVKKLDKIIYEQILAENTSMVKTRKPGEVSQYLHPISNTEDTLSRHKIAQEIRTAIEEMSQDETDYSEIEVEWLLFQLEIQETKKDYIGQSEYMNIAQNCNMTKSDARNALKFFHEVGIFFYYEKVVDVVFCNPQWLFDRLTNLIVQKYDPLNYSIENNIKKGKFSREDIDSIYAKMIDPTGPLKLEDILNIFVDHNIMACLPNKSEYFMPALLSPSPPNAFLSKPCDEKVGSTLYIEFENTFVPRGVFCCLVVNLAKEGWVITENKAYKDIVLFQITKNQQAVFMDKIKYICLEVYVKKGEQIPGKRDSYEVCKLFKMKLLNICAQMKIDCTCKVGFSCTNPVCSQVVCFPDFQFPYSVESKCKSCYEINSLDYDQLVWLLPSYLTDRLKQQLPVTSHLQQSHTGEAPTPGAKSKISHQDGFCFKPNERILARLKGILTPHWRDIGYELIKPEDVRVIDCNSQVDKEEKCFTMLLKWLEADATACYCKLIKALNIYELFGIVDKVKERIQA